MRLDEVMDKKIKAKWVEALRSGKYQQGKLSLRTTTKAADKFCCLGVLCDVVQPESWHRTTAGWFNDGSQSQLPYELRIALGIKSVTQVHLIDMNDTGARFSEIADYIEENL